MKKKLLILSASIGLILACFPFTLCAEEDPQSNLGVSPPPAYYQLDDYFYDNYVLLPYIESTGNQYIDTGIVGKNSYRTDIKFSSLSSGGNYAGIFGDGNSVYSCFLEKTSGNTRFKFNLNTYQYSIAYQDYEIYDIVYDQNNVYLNNSLVHEFNDESFTGSSDIYLFCLGPNNATSSYKLFSFSVYDYSANDGDGAYIRYYYPAQAISSGTIGLYDAVSKTFVTTGSASPFVHPDGTEPLDFSIGLFITSGLGWISDILDFAIAEPLIICFMAIGLAGAMFRWGRRLVHF